LNLKAPFLLAGNSEACVLRPLYSSAFLGCSNPEESLFFLPFSAGTLQGFSGQSIILLVVFLGGVMNKYRPKYRPSGKGKLQSGRCSKCRSLAKAGDTLCGTCKKKSETNRRRQENGSFVSSKDREALVSAIRKVNSSLSGSQARELAEMIEHHGKQKAVRSGASIDERARVCGEYKINFGQWSGYKLKDVSPDYVIWLAGIVEERRHSIDFLNAIRAARAIKDSWEPRLPETTEVPFDC
jgi:hypothetical protein